MLLKIFSFNFDDSYFKFAAEIRNLVFVQEQSVSMELEYDGYDEEAKHYIVFIDDLPAATARYRIINESIKIERMAVKKQFRGKGIGHVLLKFILNDVKTFKKKIFLNAQATVTSFYEYNGFEITGNEFYEASIKHFKMNFIKKFFIIIILFFSFSSYAQNKIIAVSNDGEYIAIAREPCKINDTILIKDSTSYNLNSIILFSTSIDIYMPSTGKHVQNIKLKTENQTNIKSAFFSINKYTFCVNNNGKYHLWNIPSAKKLKAVIADTLILSNRANSFFSLSDNIITKQSYFYNTKILYKCPENTDIIKIGITSDDKFLLAKTKSKWIYIWELKIKNTEPKKIFGDDFSVDNNKNFFISKYYKGKTTITKYNSKNNSIEFEKEKTIRSHRFIKPGKIFKRKIINQESGFSPNGNYYVYTSKKLFSKRITIVNLLTGVKIFETKKRYRKYKKSKQYFFSDSICLLQTNQNEIAFFDLNETRIIDNNVVLNNNDILQLLKYKPIVQIVTDSNYYFVKNAVKQQNYLPLNTIKSDTIVLKLDKPIIKQRKIKKQFYNSDLDTMAYISIEKLIHISENKDSTIMLLPKSIQITDDYTGLQFYIVDEKNTLFVVEP